MQYCEKNHHSGDAHCGTHIGTSGAQFFWLAPITRSRHTSPANLCTAPILCMEDAKGQTIHGRTFWSINSTRCGRNEVISKAKEEKHYLGSAVMCQDYDHQEGGSHRIAPQPRGPAKEELPPNFQSRTLPELFSDLTERCASGKNSTLTLNEMSLPHAWEDRG